MTQQATDPLYAKYLAVFAATPDALAIARERDALTLEVNDAWMRVTGYTRGQAIGRSALELGLWADPAQRGKAIEQLNAHGNVSNFPARFRMADGRIIDVLLSGAKAVLSGEPCVVWSWRDVSEQLQQRHALAEAQEQFEKAFHSSQEAIGISRLADSRIIIVNRRMEDLYGAAAAEMVGRTTAELNFWGGGEPQRQGILDLLRRERKIRDLEVTVRTRSGEHRVCSYSSELLELRGEPHVIGFLRDVTEQRRAEEAKRQALERFEQVFAHSPESITISRLSDGKILAVNDAWLQHHHIPREQAVGRTTVELGLWGTEDRETMREKLAKDGRIMNHVLSIKKPDGSSRETLLSLVVIQMEGEPCIIGMGRDISEQRRAEEALQSSRRLLETVIDAIPMSIFAKDLGSNYVMINQYMARFFGVTKEALLHHHTSELPSRDATRQQSLRDDQWVYQNRKPHVHETWIEKPDGTPVPFHSSKIPLYDGSGELMGLLGINRDISEDRRAQAALRELNVSLEQRVRERTAELEVANRDLESFGYSVSHDLRAPLGAINGFAYLLRLQETARLSPDGAHLLRQLEANALRLTGLVEGLLEFSRLGRRTVTRVAVAMDELVQEVIADMHAEHRGRRIEFRVGELPHAQGDPILLRQVWKNLIGNAAKYSSGRDPAIVEVGYEGAPGAYFVRDNGAGFDMAYAARLFGVFERLHGEAEFEGAGVGLAIVQRIIQRHGGEVRGEGSPGAGATFRFTLWA